MRKTPQLLGLIAVSLALSAEPALAQKRGRAAKAAAEAIRGEMLAQSCFGCHGPAGASLSAPMPTIGGQDASYLTITLKAHRDDKRPTTVMGRIMKGYTDQEISALSQYISKQPFVRAEQTVADKAKLEIGKNAYQRVCKDCHASAGRESTEPEYPILAGQWLSYMQLSIGDILAGKREVDEKFQASLSKLNKDEIDAVLHYFAAQR